ncbi:hypothetical protein KNE206_37540 [Kitasatospora sp. NE20-6]
MAVAVPLKVFMSVSPFRVVRRSVPGPLRAGAGGSRCRDACRRRHAGPARHRRSGAAVSGGSTVHRRRALHLPCRADGASTQGWRRPGPGVEAAPATAALRWAP